MLDLAEGSFFVLILGLFWVAISSRSLRIFISLFALMLVSLFCLFVTKFGAEEGMRNKIAKEALGISKQTDVLGDKYFETKVRITFRKGKVWRVEPILGTTVEVREK